MKISLKLLSMIMAISLLLTGSILPISATALTDDNNLSNEFVLNEEMLKNEELILSDETVLRAEDPEISEESMILKYVDSSQFNVAKHVQRLTELEDLNTYVFANADGTRSIYMMHENVKYVDKNGTVREKDISLKSKTGGFGIVQSDVKLLIPNNPIQGIDLEYSGFAIKLIPQGIANTTSVDQTDYSVVYDKAYGENTKLVYTPLLSGVKEDIVLNEYTANATYTFVLETDGLSIFGDEGNYYLASSENADPVFYLGEIVIYDAVGKPDIGTMTVETLSEGQEYLLTVTADDDFLSDPTTVYPVTIDPSVTVSDSTTTGSIVDAPIFAGYPSKNFGTYVYNRVGTPSEAYGIGRTVVKLSGLMSLSTYQTIAANQITNVTFYAKEASGGTTQYINLYPLTSNTTWTESGVTWNNVGSYSTAVNYGNTMYNNQWTAFNITNLVKAWKNGTYTADAGFIMTNENEANNKCFCSSEYSTASYRPYVVMTYKGAVNVSASPTYMLVGQTKQVSCSTNPSGLSVSWSSNNTSVATVNSSGLVTGVSEGTVKITATYTDSTTGTTSSGYVYLYVKDSIGIKDNTKYYVMNYSSRRYLSLEAASDTNLTNVYTRARSTSTLSQWKTEKQTDGTFQLISVYSSTGKVLDKTGTNIDIYTDNGASYQKFAIYRINSGIYKGLYYIRHGSYYVAQDSDYNVYLTTTANSSAVWSFMAIDTRYANYYSIAAPNTNGRYDNYKSVMNSLGYTSNNWHCVSANSAYGFLRNTNDIFTFVGHGLETTSGQGMATICFQNSSGGYNGYITTNGAIVNGSNDYAIDDLDKNALSLERFVLYLGCKTGQTYTVGGTSYNLVQSTYDKGAHFVLGTLETITVSEAYSFLDTFLNNCSTKSVYDSISSILGDDPLFDAYYMGDSRQFIAVE
mgnify:CR=1 FL=1